MNSYSTSKLFTHKPVINFVPGTTDQKYEPVLTVHEDRVFYFGNNNLLSLYYDSKDWKEEAPPPFKVDYGYSMSSTPVGLVIFGGCLKDGKIISDTWIYSFDRWRALTHNAAPRCNHASTWIPTLDALLISGGYNNEGFLGDFLLLDLKSGYTREFPLQYPLSFAFHTVTVITNNMLCLYGGKCSDGSQNNKTFLININDGSIREINVVPFFEPRYLHRAFNFYGNLLVTGGYSETNSFNLINNAELNKQKGPANMKLKLANPSNSNVPLLFIFLHRVWLTFFLPESIFSLIPEIGYILSLNKGLMFISPNGSQSAVLYFNEAHEPFAGTKDTRYITFLNNLLCQNLNYLNLNPENSPVEKRRKDLLEKRRDVYKEISSKLGVEDLSFLVNERDLLNCLLSKISVTPASPSNNDVNLSSNPPNSNSSANRKRSNSQVVRNLSMIQIPQPDDFDYTNLKQDALDNLETLNTLKEQNKETLARTSKTVESLYQEVQLLMSQKGINGSTNLPKTNDSLSEITQKITMRNLSTLYTEIDRAKFHFKSIVEQLDIYNKMKNDSCRDAINVYERIDNLLSERHKKKESLIELQKKYLKNSEDMLSKMAEIYNLSKANENNEKLKKLEKSILSSYDKLKSIKVDHRTFVNQLNDQLLQLKAKIEKLHTMTNFQSREQLLAHTIQTSEVLSLISNTFNDYCKNFANPDENLKLPEIKNPMMRISHLTVSMKHGRRTSFSADSQVIQDGLWNTFYDIVNNIFADIEILNKK